MAAAAAAASSTASATKFCFNSNCKETLETPRKGWRRRTGEFADLCDRCASAYEDGKFCESFHLNASGWRCCESCGKQIHCGCIVSFHMFVLLDAGGIECITCARKSFILTPNPAWPPPSLFLPLQPERIKDLSVKNWSPIAGSGPVPWRQAPSLFNGSTIQSELQPRVPVPVEFDVSGGVDRLQLNERLSSSLEKRKKEESFEKLMNGSLRICSSGIGSGTSGAICDEQSIPFLNASQQTVFPSTSDFSVATALALKNESNDHSKVSGTPIQRITQSPPTEKRPYGQNPADSSEGQLRNGRVARSDVRARNQLLPRYWPRITDQELQQISGDSNSVITPLFEKMLSASDAGRIGRLVLPKKCAEAYFPPISQPEGLPLKIQDLKGKEWVFQFRFWPNNNSRMYVLEGITPCIQSMQLQAGDVVTFSRIEPEGKLVMGCRKASSAPSDQGNEASNAGHVYSSNGDVTPKSNKAGEITKPSELVPTNTCMKGHAASSSLSSLDQAAAKSGSTWSEFDRPGHVAKEVFEAKSSVRTKRRNSTLGLKSKRHRIENEDMLELKVTWEQVQGLFRPPPNNAPSVVVIEGCEIEEYEDAPVIGRPTIPATDYLGKQIQWIQCEDCSKWRKIPADAVLQSNWTCSENPWDPERSLCSAVQEISVGKLKDLLPAIHKTSSKKLKASKQNPESVEALEGLDTLANLALQEKSRSFPASQATTKHPRHRAGCSCIVCIQPPSGKGPKHKQPCECVVCKSLKRRFKTLMLKKEKKQTERGSETMDQILKQQGSPEQAPNGHVNKSPKEEVVSDEGCIDNPDEKMRSASPFKGQIDLNIQPEKEEELSPSFYSGSTALFMPETQERHNRQQRLSGSSGRGNLVGNQMQQDGTGRTNFSNRGGVHDSHKRTDAGPRISSSKEAVASLSSAR